MILGFRSNLSCYLTFCPRNRTRKTHSRYSSPESTSDLTLLLHVWPSLLASGDEARQPKATNEIDQAKFYEGQISKGITWRTGGQNRKANETAEQLALSLWEGNKKINGGSSERIIQSKFYNFLITFDNINLKM